MKKYFTAVGKVLVKTLTESGYKDSEHNYQHVVQADDADEAEEKLMDYYFNKSEYYEQFVVLEVEIFDFIE